MSDPVRILIVEDSYDDAEQYCKLLSMVQGHTYSWVITPSSTHVLEAISTGSFDCVLLDYSLPGMDGLELLRRIRDVAPFLPVVMLTGQARDDLAAPILSSGASNYLEKAHVNQAELHRAISSALSFCAAARLRSRPASRKMLLIDDVSDDREAIVRMLRSTSYPLVQIVESASGEDALTQLARFQFECVLLDHGLPGLSGLDLIPEIRGRYPFLPIIFMTGVGSVTLAVKALRAGANDYLSKSALDVGKLVRSIDDAIRSGESAAKDAEILSKTMALAESEENGRLILENSKDMISRVAASGTRLYVSASVRRMFGISPNDFTEQKLRTLIHPDDISVVENAQAQLLAGKTEEASFVFRIYHPESGERWLETGAWPYTDERSSPAGYISVTRDVTDRVHLETEREEQRSKLRLANVELDRQARAMADARAVAESASRTKTRFLAGVTHELRTPLHGIMGYVQILLMDAPKNLLLPQQVRILSNIEESCKHLFEIISRVLDIAEIESGHMASQPEEFAVDTTVMSCVCLVQPTAESKGLELTVSRTAEMPDKIYGDATHFRQIIVNLLGNAIKFTAVGHVAVQIGRSADGTALRVEVADTGPGITADQRPLLFQEFERMETEATSGSEGAGLGLALSARLAAFMGGRLGQQNKPGGGSVFWLELPLTASPAPPPAVSTALQPLGKRTRGRDPVARPMNILIADDSAINREIVGRFLCEDGHTVHCVNSGTEAVEFAATVDFDCILLDVRMPGMDGLEATRRIRALEGKRGRVPIVALTAQVFTDQLAACRAAGMDYHLGKPFTPEMLLDAVIEAVTTDPRPGEKAASVHPKHDEATVEPIFKHAIFTVMTDGLPPDVVASYLAAIVDKGKALALKLEEPDVLVTCKRTLADEAHAIAGSAAMLGYMHLAEVGRRFERLIELGEATSAHVLELRDAIKATCEDATTRRNGQPTSGKYGNVVPVGHQAAN